MIWGVFRIISDRVKDFGGVLLRAKMSRRKEKVFPFPSTPAFLPGQKRLIKHHVIKNSSRDERRARAKAHNDKMAGLIQ